MPGANSTPVAIVAGAAVVAAAILFSSGRFEAPKDEPAYVQAVRDQMIDPGSTEFRNVRKHKLLDIWCGELNSKNRAGGFVGWQPFTAFAPIDSRPDWLVTVGNDPTGRNFDACQ